MIKAVFFDVNGVLVQKDDQPGRRQLEARFGMEKYDLDWLVFNSKESDAATVGELGTEAVWQMVKNRLDLSEEEMPTLVDLFWQGNTLDRDLLDFLVSLQTDYITGVLSNAWPGAREEFASQYGIIEGENVDHVLISCELGLAKPDPAIFHRLREIVAVEFDEILFVDDFGKNIESAKALGMVTVHYRTGANPINQIKSMLD
ncbi:HAD-IA family hydrolase [bacterium]|nr:HAD-IA family hydrolase [bacterium]